MPAPMTVRPQSYLSGYPAQPSLQTASPATPRRAYYTPYFGARLKPVFGKDTFHRWHP